ncbi:MAG TPA: helix-turn-helix domain-containing protein [Pseudonocardiaceae bacterium]|nr:helix-turn-helix domain-containing protein [Pseudonocardiaceae bacterium]
MGDKPLRADARRNRELVLAAARDLLAADGAAVSFDTIARAAGVGVGTVYRHFPDRQALFAAVILDRIVTFASDARGATSANDPGEAFVAFFERLARQVAFNQALCDAMDGGLLVPEDLRAEFLAALGDLLSHAQQAGAIRADLDVADLLDLVIGFAAAARRGRADRILAVATAGLRVRAS